MLSTTIQLATAKNGGITLIDEIEQGLEPDRVKKLVNLIKTTAINTNSQIFITTHSNNVITELGADNIFIIRRDSKEGIQTAKEVSIELNNVVRACSEAFFARKVIVCEGKTEVGICRAMESYLGEIDNHVMSYYGCVAIEGNGSTFAKYSKSFKDLGFEILTFCDSDRDCSPSKDELSNNGIELCDCEEGNSIEKQVFKDLPYSTIKEIVDYVIKEKYDSDENSFIASAKANNTAFPDNWKEYDDNGLVRKTLANLSAVKEWFKRIDRGEELGKIIFRYFKNLSDETHLKQQLNQIIRWVKS